MRKRPHDKKEISLLSPNAMTVLTVDQIIQIHAGVIAHDGGDSRILSEAALHQMVFYANGITDSYRRAAFALYSLCAYPPFREGNEQTARVVMEQILLEGGLHLPSDANCIVPLIAGIAAYSVEPEEIELVLRAHAQ